MTTDNAIYIKLPYFFRLFLRAEERIFAAVKAFLLEGTAEAEEQGDAALGQDEINTKAAQLLDKYGNKILRLAYSYLRNMADAEDIVQDTLIQYLRKPLVFSDETHEVAWLMRVAANLSKNRIRYNSYRTTDELNEELAAEEREDLSFVWEAVNSLPVPYREIVHLYYYEGYSTMQIASILSKKESTVRSCLARGRAKLKSILQKEYDFDGEI